MKRNEELVNEIIIIVVREVEEVSGMGEAVMFVARTKSHLEAAWGATSASP